MSKVNLPQIFDHFNKLKIIIIGDVMIDAYLWGEVTRISPEAPVPILSKTTHENRLGGAANVALNIQSLGATPILCSIIGNDTQSEVYLKLMDDNKLTSKGIIKADNRTTTVKTRIISQNQHMLRVDEEDDKPVSSDQEDLLFTRISQIIEDEKIDAIVFEDYDKGVITSNLIKQVVNLAKTKQIPTLVDPKKRNFNHYKGVTFFKPNFKEFKEGLKIDISKKETDKLIEEASRYLTSTQNDFLMITMAELGVFISSKTTHHLYPAQKRKIIDVSGAGDTVISVCTLCLASGIEPSLIAQIANMAGGLVCEKPGVVPIDKQTLLNECISKIPELTTN
jgi:D-glycero-beta-D-manno-heptose-7-phosphate kinase